MRITGTFLDEISHDIPSANWGPIEWAADFDAMKAIGIDTVIIIRAGYKDRCTFDSHSLARYFRMRPAYLDLVDVFLDNAERCGMKLFFGTYDSGVFWHGGQPDKEVEINLAFTEEAHQRYGDRSAFAGWYISHEITAFNDGVMGLYERLARHLRNLRDLPILMSPYIRGSKISKRPTTPDEHRKQWEMVFSRLGGLVDIVAFQDGQVEFGELAEYMQINSELARKDALRCWSNVETFERGMPIRYLPIAWPNLRFKIDTAAAANVEKLITFEFSHFMSPNSVYPSARNLYERYLEWIEHA